MRNVCGRDSWSAVDFLRFSSRKIGPRIQRKVKIKFREAIPASILLAVTLRYLASGDYISTLAVMTSYILRYNQSRHLSYCGYCNPRNELPINTLWTANPR